MRPKGWATRLVVARLPHLKGEMWGTRVVNRLEAAVRGGLGEGGIFLGWWGGGQGEGGGGDAVGGGGDGDCSGAGGGAEDGEGVAVVELALGGVVWVVVGHV